MLGMAPDYDHLPVINKVEVFEYALDSTSGEDLHKVRICQKHLVKGLRCFFVFLGLAEYALDSTSGDNLQICRHSFVRALAPVNFCLA
jgi:hypothetical protein